MGILTVEVGTLLPCPGGRTTKSAKDMWWHWGRGGITNSTFTYFRKFTGTEYDLAEDDAIASKHVGAV